MTIPPNPPGNSPENTGKDEPQTLNDPSLPHPRFGPHTVSMNKKPGASAELRSQEQLSDKDKSLMERSGTHGTPSNVSTDLDIESILSNDNCKRLKQLLSNDDDRKKTLIPDDKGLTLLHKACAYGAGQCVRMLMETAPDDLHKQDNDGNMPLHVAVVHHRTCCVEIILKKDSSCTQCRNHKNHTPYYLAILCGDRATLKEMLNVDALKKKLSTCNS